ncbi:596_t:CDS:2 [Paraglomus brasilianum]|uniref:596_t:CDS:1 n=1 Tax=Paraglomus brasilianum TaxID=144538 RepID=A0A9N8ZB43_9GLOM|nr:596_t:CDS:2 [Paraglomus brasilianum]
MKDYGVTEEEAIRKYNESKQGGLGGTLMDGSERGLGYEGVGLSDEVVCKRKLTLQKLQQALSDNNKGVILVRAPPMAGKTLLAQLFEHYLLELPEFQSRSFGCHCCG